MLKLRPFYQKNIWLILLIIVIVPSFISLIRPGFFPMQDDLQAFRIQQLDKCIVDLQIPCRWIPDAGFQYGYPQFNFYPPSVYYLGEIFHLVGFQFIDAVKILFILGFILSAVTMFIFLRSLFGDWPAIVGAVLYTYVPYKAVDVYVRGALSEFWAFVFFPLIFWAIFKLIQTGKLKYLVWMAVSIGLLLTTHNLMSMIFLPIAGMWIVIWLLLERAWRVIPKLMIGVLVGIGLAAFFTLPVIFERQYVHVESMLGGYFDYRQHFVNLEQLFLSNYWGYGSSQLGPGDDLSLSTGPIHTLAGFLAVILSLVYLPKKPKISLFVIVLAIVDLAVLFLTHQRSTFIWERVEVLSWLQFPWRFLADSVFLLSVLGTATIYLLGQGRGIILGGVLMLAVLALHLSFFQPKEWFPLSDTEKFSGNLWEKELTISIFDYLPIYAKLPPTSRAPATPEILDGRADFVSYKKGSDHQEGRVIVQKTATIRLPLFDFPGMQVKVDDKVVPHRHDDCRGEKFCLGLISFNLSEGEHIIEARLTNTEVRALANTITLVSLFIIGTLVFKK